MAAELPVAILRLQWGIRECLRGQGEVVGIYVRRIVVGLSKLLLAVVVGATEDWARPICEEALGLSLDDQLGALALDVEHDDLADSGCDEGVLVDRQLGQRSKELFLDVIGGQTAVAQGLEEEAHCFEDVGLGVHD